MHWRHVCGIGANNKLFTIVLRIFAIFVRERDRGKRDFSDEIVRFDSNLQRSGGSI